MWVGREKNMSAVSLPILSSTDDVARLEQSPEAKACAIYWRLYWAWIQAPEKQREAHRERLTDHISVCGCRMGMGGRQDKSDTKK